MEYKEGRLRDRSYLA